MNTAIPCMTRKRRVLLLVLLPHNTTKKRLSKACYTELSAGHGRTEMPGVPKQVTEATLHQLTKLAVVLVSKTRANLEDNKDMLARLGGEAVKTGAC